MSSDKAGLPLIGWFDEPAKQSIKSVFDDLNNATEALDIFRKYRRAHFAAIGSALGNFKVLGMQRPVGLSEIYSPTFVSTTIYRRLYEQQWLEIEAEDHPTRRRGVRSSSLVRGDSLVDETERVMVLGGPGSGKTTFLRYLALAYSNQEIFSKSKLTASRFPFFVSLLRYSENDPRSIEGYLSRDLKERTDEYAPHFVRRVLKKGLAIVLMDGLDEVPVDKRKKVTEQILRLCDMFPKAKMVLSCRTADYGHVLEPFVEVEVARLRRSAVKKTIKAWFKDTPSKAEVLLKELRRDEDVLSLVETPLLLSLLCIQFRHDMRLPKRKTELFRRCVEALLREWDASRGFRRDSAYSALDDDRKMRIFEFVAGKYSKRSFQYLFPARQLSRSVGEFCRRFGVPSGSGMDIVREIESHHGIFEQFSANFFMFSHPSFHEYFAARHFLAQRNEMDVVRRKADDSRWSSTIEFMAALHEEPTPILEHILTRSEMNVKTYPAMARRARHLWLLYRCLSAGASVMPKSAKRFYRHIVDSQLQMLKIFGDSGVFPVAILEQDGVRHSYFYYKRRSTLQQALQPLRMLANEILAAPSYLYADLALEKAGAFREEDLDGIYGAAAVTCLVTPLISARSKKAVELLDKVATLSTFTGVPRAIEESRRAFKVYETQ